MSDELEALPPDCAELLVGVSNKHMSAEVKARLWDRIDASASAMASLPLAVTPSPTVAPGVESVAAAGSMVVGKWGATLAAAAFATGIAAGGAIDHFVFPPPPQIIEKIVVRVEPGPPSPVPTVEPQTVPSPPVMIPKPLPQRAQRIAPRPMETPSDEERQLLERARTALLKKDARSALDALLRHRHDFPNGQLTEECDGLEVQALLQLGRLEEAKVAAKRFNTTYPQSILGPAIDAAVNSAEP